MRPGDAAAMICVVIPYFQREPGILRRALASIAAQRDCPLPMHVIVVDDASPIPAAAEVAALGKPPFSIEVVAQPNAGPGGARNSGLDRVPAGARYVAFLDSDDEWTPEHLARAVSALQAGFDFYFTDLMQLGADVTAFKRAGRIDPSAHEPIPNGRDGLFAYRGDMLDQIIRGNVIGTPTVVYDAERFAALRFKPEFASAGEDYLFWMDIAQHGARIAFSTECEVKCGRGVNVFAGSGWGTEAHLQRIHDEIRFKKLTQRLYRLNDGQQAHLAADIARLRLSFARDVLHRLSHRNYPPARLLMSHLALDPLSFLMLPPNAMRLLRERG
jgi:succinoglycan biosynthesis protein ExoW